MGAGTTAAPDVIEKLKASNATRLVAFFANGETKPLALPEVRNKWLRTRALLANVGPWVKLEGYDKSGALLCVIENPDVVLEDLEPDFASDDARQVAPLLGLMLRAQDTVLHRFQSQQKHLLDSHLELLRLVSARLMASEKATQEANERAQSYAEALAEVLAKAGSGSDDEISKLIEALPAVAKLGGLLRGGVEKKPGQKSGPAEKAPNGK